MFVEDESGPDERQQGLEQLDLSDFGDASAREARVRGEAAEEHRDDRDIGEAEPRGRPGVHVVVAALIAAIGAVTGIERRASSRSFPPIVPSGGFSLWVRLPEGLDDVAITAVAEREGVIVSPGRPWFPAEPPGPFLRLTFAAAPADEIDRGARVLGEVVARQGVPARRRRLGVPSPVSASLEEPLMALCASGATLGRMDVLEHIAAVAVAMGAAAFFAAMAWASAHHS